jgi:signal transduction histidine kinase
MRRALAVTTIALVVSASVALVAALSGASAAATSAAAAAPLALVLVVATASLAPVAAPYRARLARALVFAGAVAVTAGASIAAVVLVMGHLPDRGQQRFVVPAAAAAALAAGSIGAVRRRLPAVSDRLVARTATPADIVRSFGDRTSRDLPDEEVLRGLAEALRRVMRLRVAEVWTLTGGQLRRTVSVPARPPAAVTLDEHQVRYLSGEGVFGRAWLELWLPALVAEHRTGDARVVPAAHGGELLGLLLLGRGHDDLPFTMDDDRALADLGRRVGIVLHNRQLDSALRGTLADLRRSNRELAGSRARLVAAADAERRRLERDLHDGAQQHLLALALELRRVRDVIERDPASAGALLDGLGRDVRGAIDELRDLAHGIYPPLLLESGLGAALQGAVARVPVKVTVDAELDVRYPPEVEAAVYFSCLEALQNVVKHAPGSAATVRLWRDRSLLWLEVSDEGEGFDPATIVAGMGLQSIQDRVGAVGGTVEWRPGELRGTRMIAAVPEHVAR